MTVELGVLRKGSWWAFWPALVGGRVRSTAWLSLGSMASVSFGHGLWVLCGVVLRRFDLCETVAAQMGCT